MTFLHSVFEHAIDRGWCARTPYAARRGPAAAAAGDADPDLQFLTVDELDAVLRAIPDDVVMRTPAPTRAADAGRRRRRRRTCSGRCCASWSSPRR